VFEKFYDMKGIVAKLALLPIYDKCIGTFRESCKELEKFFHSNTTTQLKHVFDYLGNLTQHLEYLEISQPLNLRPLMGIHTL
jgi:hypothetical protein